MEEVAAQMWKIETKEKKKKKKQETLTLMEHRFVLHVLMKEH